MIRWCVLEQSPSWRSPWHWGNSASRICMPLPPFQRALSSCYSCRPVVWSFWSGRGCYWSLLKGSMSSSSVSQSVFCPHRVPGRELSEFRSAFCLCANANSPSFSQNSPSLPQNSVRLSEFSSPKQYSRNSIPPVS